MVFLLATRTATRTARTFRTSRLARATIAASALLLLAAPTAVASAQIPYSAGIPSSALFTEVIPLLQQQGLNVQLSGGFLAAEGPATLVKTASESLMRGGVGNTALYTGAGETSTGVVVISGNGVLPTTDFQVMEMIVANVENNSTQRDAVYSDNSSALAAVVAPGTDADITPVDVDFAAYPVGSAPPPDNHGLNPDAQFTFDGLAPFA
jgi:hypothetical protein